MSVIETMVIEGHNRVEVLQARIAQIGEDLERYALELTGMQDAALAREETIGSARISLLEAEAAHTTATGYAQIASETPREAQALREVAGAKKALDAARKVSDRLAKEEQEAAAKSATRRDEIIKASRDLESERKNLLAEISKVRAGLEKARSELGDEVYSRCVVEYEAKQREVEKARERLIAAQAELIATYQDGCMALVDYPVQVKRFECLMPLDNSTTRVFQATIDYLETMIDDADDLDTSRSLGWYNLWEMLIVPHQQLHGSPGELRLRQERLKQMLAEYRRQARQAE